MPDIDPLIFWEERLVNPNSFRYLSTKDLLEPEIFQRLLNSLRIAESYSRSTLIDQSIPEALIKPLLKDFYFDLANRSLEEISQNVINYYVNYISSKNDDLLFKIAQFEILCISILFLNIYMQANWTGPPFKIDDNISKDWRSNVGDTNIENNNLITDIDETSNNYLKDCILSLRIDGEYLYQRCNLSPYLTWSIIFIQLLSNREGIIENHCECDIIRLSSYKTLDAKIPLLSFINFWKQRFYRIWQRSLEGGIKFASSPYLESVILEKYHDWLKNKWNLIPQDFPINDRYKDNFLRSFQFEKNIQFSMPKNIDKSTSSIFILDLAVSLASFGRANPCAILLKYLAIINGFKYSFTGALGQKRISQRESTVQLVVEVIRDKEFLEKSDEAQFDNFQQKKVSLQIPENVLLENINPDNDLYENVKLDDENNDSLTSSLNIIEQCVLLVHGVAIYETSPTNDVIAYEQLNALTNRILKYDVTKIKDENIRKKIHNWLCFSTALWYRCYAEHHRGRTADRACLQLQSLVDQFNDKEPGPEERLKLVFSVNYPNVWEAKKELGIRMMRIGSVLSAYNMFVEMCMWEDAVDCLIVADRKTEAIELVKEQLKIRETPRLYCSLGDLTQDISYYQKAWNFSHHRYARAQRSLGNAYFKKAQFENALEAYTKALSINSTNLNCWFSLGCVALRLEKWDIAQQSFSRVVSLDPQQAEAWANLAASLSKKELWNEAQNAINEGLKYSRENWMMWDSSLKIAIQRNDLNRIIECLSNILKLPSNQEHFPIWCLPKIIELLKSEKYFNEMSNDKPFSLINKSLDLLNKLSQISSKPIVFYILSEIQIMKNDYNSAYPTKLKELRGSIEVIFNDKIAINDREKYLEDIPNIINDIKHIISKCDDSTMSNEQKYDEINMLVNTIIKRLEVVKPQWSNTIKKELCINTL